MHSISFTIPSLSRGTLVILLVLLAALICHIVGAWRARDSRLVGYPIPLPNNLHGLGSLLLAKVLAIIAVALWLGRLLK